MELWLGTGVCLLAASVFGAMTYVGWTGLPACREVRPEEQPRQDARLLFVALAGPGTALFFLVLAAGLHGKFAGWIWPLGIVLVDLIVTLGVLFYGRPQWLVPSPYRPWTGLLDRPNRRIT